MDHMGIHYNIWIMLLSFALSVLASYSALNLICQVPSSSPRTRRLWLLSGACVLGIGIWAMHYVGILASGLPIGGHYNAGMAILSMFIGTAFCYFGLSISMGKRTTFLRCAAGGLLLGAGISALHYAGRSWMKPDAQIGYNLPGQSISVMIAIIASCMGIMLIGRFKDSPGFNWWKLYSALLLGAAISSVHYTSMGASGGTHGSWLVPGPSLMQSDVILLMSVSLLTLFMFGITGGAVFLDRHVLERMAYHDPLTGLPNRHGLERYFKDRFLHGRSGAVFFIDLDRFKSINDTLGHDIGDMLLQEVASRLLQSVSSRGKVFRLGGDEFLIAEPGFSPNEAAEEAQRILQEIKKSFRIQDNDLYVTASVGISMAPVHGTDRSSLMKAADTALYSSKDSGKNKFSIFDSEMNRHQLRRMSLEKDLRKALAQSEFMVVYQPKWDSLMNVTVGLEALLRWRHPEHGIISPAEFIPIAEETGLIVPITYWMLHEVCSQNLLWHKEGVASVAVSINMSARMFETEDLYEVVVDALSRSGLDPQYLELEITESIAMNNMEETVAQLSKLRRLGVRVSLDDFGTGFSSLGNLDEIPVNTLKIDQVFIRKSKMHSKKAIISNIIAIASNLNMEVVAEGVETPEQIELLQSLGCRVMQGYYYGRPMPVHELGQWFTDNAAVV
ncbi:diguanylate cyclase (GGDEF) domain-containing protein [Paenibacillus sophorae]|uniref:Diguanylate cyclase (GGDEF) domain-containing protein n=1 Tax=Paenibacillus sophorae TaxID=1333845 RepID=A0A1H8IJ07_9BACL|nr:EAL domain-containing protein [Paenibacillus sophorae]SEN68219.1 diguanylate cyclase (GGDEF) domain-containing protein [Paenibacillus sophorae]